MRKRKQDEVLSDVRVQYLKDQLIGWTDKLSWAIFGDKDDEGIYVFCTHERPRASPCPTFLDGTKNGFSAPPCSTFFNGTKNCNFSVRFMNWTKKLQFPVRFFGWDKNLQFFFPPFWNLERELWKLGTLPPGLITFYRRVSPLERSWHVLGLGYNPKVNQKEIERAAVIHYNGNLKPWLEIGIPKFRGYWSRFMDYDHPYMRDC